MTTLHRIRIDPAKLRAMPEAERTLLLVMGHLANEINSLTKLFFWAAHGGTGGEIQQKGSTAQSYLLARLLCGKLSEGWQLLRHTYYASKLSQLYSPLLDQDTKDALKDLGRLFNSDNTISLIRNNFAFHYSAQDIANCFANSDREDALELFMSNDNANSLYDLAEIIVNQTMLEAIDKDDPRAAMNRLMHESTLATGLFNRVIGGCVSLAIKRHLGDDLDALGATEVVLDGLPDFKAFSIPYFVEISQDEPGA